MVGEGSVWFLGGSGEVVRIDPATNEILATIHTGYEDLWALAVGAGSVWATTHHDPLLRIDPTTNAVEAIPAPASTVHGVTVLDGVVWVVARNFDDGPDYDQGQGERFGVDPASRAVVAHVPVTVYDRVTAGFGSLWGKRGISLVRVDPTTGFVLATIDVGYYERNTYQTVVAVGEGAVWVAVRESGHMDRILRIDPGTNRIVGEILLPEGRAGGIPGIAAGAGVVWVTDGLGTLYRIDPSAFDAEASP